jgi:hypothetical protein
MNERKSDFPNQKEGNMSENESILILRAFILDTQIETPERMLIVKGKKHELMSELFKQNPELREQMIKDRVEVFQELGWELPDAK